MKSSSTLSYVFRNAESSSTPSYMLPCNQASLGVLPGYNQHHHHHHHHHSLLPTFSPTILPDFEPTNLWQEVHAGLRPEEEKQGHMLLPNRAINFGSAVANNCGGGPPAIIGYDIPSHMFTDERLSHMLSRGLSRDPIPLPPPHRHTLEESCTPRMMATLIENGGIKDIPHLDMVRILNNKWGSLAHDAGLTVDPSKGGLAVKQGVHTPALSMEPEFAKSAANLSYLTKQASFSSSSELAQNAAYPPVRGDEGSNLCGLGKVESQVSLLRMPCGLETPVCPPCNSPTGFHVGHQGTVQRALTIQADPGRMPSGFNTTLSSPCNVPNGCHIVHQEEHTSLDVHTSFSEVHLNADARESTQRLCISIHDSDESFGLEASSNSEQNGGFGTTIQRVNKGKNKRVKDRSKDSTAQVSNLKDLETDEVKKSKRSKRGECASEEDQNAEQSISANSNDSTPTSCNESSKPPEPSKTDYIHVRARRGQATDSHSLAERVRREKISERMKFLQDLVPGCSKVTGKALMLDEIINYVQSLQGQVEFLSMKLAAVNPRVEFDMDDLSSGIQMIQRQAPHHQSLMISAENPISYSPFPYQHQHAHAPQQMVTPCPPVNVQSFAGSDMAVSTSVASMDAYGDAISQQVTRTWDEELQHVVQLFFDQGRPAPLTSSSLQDQPFSNGQMKVEL